MSWTAICALTDIVPDTGVAALIEGRQVAIFRVGDELFALDNFDLMGGANVLSRGIIGSFNGELCVASPLYKHHYVLASGRCLEDDSITLQSYDVRVHNGMVELNAATLQQQAA